MRGVIVDDHVDGWLQDAGIDVLKETQKLLMAMAGPALGQNLAIGNVEGGKQGRRAVSDIAVGDALDIARAPAECGSPFPRRSFEIAMALPQPGYQSSVGGNLNALIWKRSISVKDLHSSLGKSSAVCFDYSGPRFQRATALLSRRAAFSAAVLAA